MLLPTSQAALPEEPQQHRTDLGQDLEPADRAPGATANKESSPRSSQEAPWWSVLSYVTSFLEKTIKSFSNKAADASRAET